jgi:hypothetical protein
VFVITTKISKTKIAAVVTVVIAAVVLAAILAAAKNGKAETLQERNGETNEERAAFLSQCGWQVNAEPIQTQSVRIPERETEVFTRYNELQQSQGFDLTEYAGKTAMRFVYEVLNYPDAEGPVYATVFVCQGKIIGGDVTDTGANGKMRGLRKSNM